MKNNLNNQDYILDKEKYTRTEKGIIISEKDLRAELAKAMGVHISRIGNIEIIRKNENGVDKTIEFDNKDND